MRADPTGHILSPGGESHHQVQQRIRDALLRLARAHPDGHVIAVGHGIAMRSLAWSLLGGTHETFQEMSLPNLGHMDILVDLADATITMPTSTPAQATRTH